MEDITNVLTALAGTSPSAGAAELIAKGKNRAPQAVQAALSALSAGAVPSKPEPEEEDASRDIVADQASAGPRAQNS